MFVHTNQTDTAKSFRNIVRSDGDGRAKGRGQERRGTENARRWTRAMEAPFEVPSRVYREIF